MKTHKTPKATRAEEAYIRDMKRRSAFDCLDTGKARILQEHEYPAPLKRLMLRERRMVHVRLPLAAKRRLEALSRQRGLSVEELATEWVQEGLARDAG